MHTYSFPTYKSELNWIQFCKLHIFWEAHKILRNLHRRFDWHYIGQIYVGNFAKYCGLLRIYELFNRSFLAWKPFGDKPVKNYDFTFFGPGEGNSRLPFIVVWSQVCSKIGVVGKSAPVLLFPTSDIFLSIFLHHTVSRDFFDRFRYTFSKPYCLCLQCFAVRAIYPATLWPNMVKLCPETSVRSFFGTGRTVKTVVFLRMLPRQHV